MSKRSRYLYSLILISWAFLLPTPLFGQQADLPDSAFECDIVASLDRVEWKIEGREKITVRNLTDQSADQLVFYLWPNRHAHHEADTDPQGNWQASLGYIDIREVRLEEEEDRLGLTGISDTLLVLELNRPLEPGETINLSISFVVKLPWRALGGAGYHGRHVDAFHWYPRLAALQTKDGLSADSPAHSSGNFGNFLVTLSLPPEFQVEATGTLTESSEANAVRTVRYEARGVRDFAWTANPLFHREQILSSGVEIVLLSQPFMDSKVHSLLERAKQCLDFFNTHQVPYPYERLVISAPPYGWQNRVVAPMMISLSQGFPTHLKGLEEKTRSPEIDLIDAWTELHLGELLCSFMPESPWMVEGIARYTAHYLTQEIYPPEAHPSALIALEKNLYQSFLNHGFGLYTGGPYQPPEGICVGRFRSYLHWCNLKALIGFTASPFHPADEHTFTGYRISHISNPLSFKSGFSLDTSAKQVGAHKVVRCLEALDAFCGPGKSMQIISEFCRRFAFKEAGLEDFLAVVHDTGDPLMATLIRGYLLDGRELDLAVDSARCRRADAALGFVTQTKISDPIQEALKDGLQPGESEASGFGVGEFLRFGTRSAPATAATPSTYLWEVVLSNRGSLVVPTTLRLTFEGGVVETKEWDGTGGNLRLTGKSDFKLVNAVIDPEGRYALDLNRLNNARSVSCPEGDLLFLAGWSHFWVQNYLNGWAFFN